ncbi:Gfo/Idh/MocA family protein [Hafnia paralvei]|jgi:predicted dehydrogenase|uniref:Gfo/Idh/MocA family oxidoreductase n=1 Tax=Hafnia paralvei TaxID=546367 RepID=A0A2A2M6Z6_9GAMM|nr:Gfo/Idh/MocA family oxidoreductase [Hafnia paralvei]KHS43622.1 oxidoreductase [Hafnia paralvei]MCK2181783.1 Gfo/Idh/MocA family oxidoreductase [Hafnia paralvei]PAV94457.1 gfo/Idh/MocA family oxidoreductase [Hafnia paralvei]TBL54674.1 Gfo/Idh/MocA family oxidoreductase [Hafnia paralvei]
MQRINAAIVGCGSIHARHVEGIKHHPEGHLHTIVELDQAKGEALAFRYGSRYVHDYLDMLCDEEIDVVHICTPHHSHREIIIAALAAGKHVFTEKPLALNVSEIQQIKQAALASKVLLGICYQNRLNPTSQKIKSMLEQQALGKMIGMRAMLTWARSEEYYSQSEWRGRFAREGGSLLINQAIHTLDLMQWFGGGVQAIKGVVDSTFLAQATEAEDTATANMMLGNGARGLFYATNCYSTDSPLLLEIQCEKGILQLHQNSLWLIVDGRSTQLVSDEITIGMEKSYWGSSHNKAISSFYRAISENIHSGYVDINQAEISLRMVDAIYQSSLLRRWITVAE